MRWSRIHAELGFTPAELTFDMIVNAVEQRMAETEDLDWKQALPVADVDRKLKEFAKDVAAMANTGGGLIVYGVREELQCAAEITPVSLAERERERMRALVARHVRPLIGGIEILPLREGDEETGVLAVSVPASPDAPHVVGERNEMGIPFRHGPHTEWMSEHQLERAYQDRFARRAGEAEALAGLIEDMKPQLDTGKGAWLVVAARLLSPLPALAGRPDPGHVDEVLTDALKVSNDVYPQSAERVAVLREIGRSAVLNPRPGLRRWVARSNTHTSPGMHSDFIHIELHHDGSSVLAIAATAWTSRTTFDKVCPVPTRMVQSALAEAVALTTTHARRRGHSGQLLVQADLLQGLRYPFAAVDNHLGNGFYVETMQIIPDTRTPLQITSVQTEVAADAKPETLRTAARQLSEDLLHQFGVQEIAIPE